MQRGENMIDTASNKEVRILGPEDFEKYDYNRPSDKWELVEVIETGHRYWSPIRALTPMGVR